MSEHSIKMKKTLEQYNSEKTKWEQSKPNLEYLELHNELANLISRINANYSLISFSMAGDRIILDIQACGDEVCLSIAPNILYNTTATEIREHDKQIDVKIRGLKIERNEAHTPAYLKLKLAMEQFRGVQQLKAFQSTEFKAPELPTWYYETSQKIARLDAEVAELKKERWLR